MSVGNTKDQGNKGNNFPYQLRMLQILDTINDSINAIPGVDFVTRTTSYQATATGSGYVSGNILVRYDIIDIATSIVTSTIWFNQSTGIELTTPPTPGTYTPITAPSTVFIGNGPAGAAVNIQDGGNSITVDDGGNPINVQGTVNTNLRDGSGNSIGSNLGSLNVNITSSTSLDVNIDQAADSILVYGFDGSANQKIATDSSGNLQVDILSIPTVDVSGSSVTVSGTVTANAGTGNFTVVQPTAANFNATVVANDLDIRDLQFATDKVDVSNSTNVGITNSNLDAALSTLANQSTLLSIDTKIPSNLTVTATRLLVDGSGVTQPVSGTVSANISGSISNTSFEATQAIAGNLNATVIGTGTFAVQASQVGTWNIATINNPVTVTGTIAVSTLPAITGSVTVSATALDIRSLTFATDKVDVSGSSVTVSGTVGVSGTIPLPTGAATEATLTTRATETTLQSVVDNVTSKIERIKGAANYSRAFTYYSTTSNVATITHTGTTFSGTEQITETFTYVNNLVDGSNVVSIIYGP